LDVGLEYVMVAMSVAEKTRTTQSALCNVCDTLGWQYVMSVYQ